MLSATLRDVWMSDKDLSSRMAYSTFVKRLGVHRCKLGISNAQSWTDRCQVCKCYDTSVKDSLTATLSEILVCLCEKDVDYMDDFQKICTDKGWMEDYFNRKEPCHITNNNNQQ